MSDMLDSSQLVSGVAILLSFFVGYKYGLKINQAKSDDPKKETSDGSGSSGLFSDFGEYKMILVVRNDLKMGKGKIGAQCGHAAVGAYQRAMQTTPQLVRRWESSGCAKIAVKCESERELMAIRQSAQAANLNTCLIRDAGRTQIEPNSKTVLAIGPALNRDLDKITGHLKLL